ncbi:oxidoreductase [Herbidospora sp. NEAU-GS84]|uniref:Oxidoreductase n=1 Tax=Herbidospora solisilvae TaxID=2696284 RepID=A0A7C9JB76_9ACTN|nr:PmoA family protein [Herbidospora solisilvae]NAS21541.1 oxidoreductase [Herbidospora solisilvae]
MDELIYDERGVEILRYVYDDRDTDVFESPKPYFHPIRTLDGDLVSAFRPHDHRWHKGLAMTVSDLSGQNFWGGGTYVREAAGYVDLPNTGTIRHDGFDRPGVQRLSWHTRDGEHWIDELREFRVTDVEDDSWALEFATTLRNVRGAGLVFGSPTTNGRPMAGYCGLFWRGPRSFEHGEVIAETGEGPDMMGRTSRWLAYVGRHDGVDRSSTLLFQAPVPVTWFVRTTPFAAVNPSIAFDEIVNLPPGESMRLGYRVVVCSGAWDRPRLVAYVKEHACSA